MEFSEIRQGMYIVNLGIRSWMPVTLAVWPCYASPSEVAWQSRAWEL